MKNSRIFVLLAAVSTFGAMASASARAQNIIDLWDQAKAPAPPALKTAKLDPKTTAFLVLDFTGAQNPAKGPCNVNNPRCLAILPDVAKMLATARQAGIYVVYSDTPAGSAADVATAIAPHPGDPIVTSGADKFVGTQLARLLAAKGIKTVIVTGTKSEGAVLETATAAVMEFGMTAVVPVDGMASPTLYAEQYVAWHLTNAPGVSAKTTLTKGDMISYTQ